MLTDWWAALLALLFPQRCPACRKWIDGTGWCPACLPRIAGLRQVALQLHNLRWLDECLTVADYAGTVQRLIRDMKFRQMTRQAVKLRQLLEYAVSGEHCRHIDAVVPVPLHATRLQERGFNQATLIFRPWAERRQLCWAEALVRTRCTAPQWELARLERRKNIKGAFTVTRPELVSGKHILLVDDIFTTGLTMEECAKELKKAGATSVRGLALASGAP